MIFQDRAEALDHAAFGNDKGLALLMQSTFILQDDLFNELG
jgi:hypothetical protein